tara:strand:- start:178 stop:1377 length:1200 start_codon:yes stop_codon:yes gene_type:complete
MHRDEQLRILNLLQQGIANNTSADAGGMTRAPVSDYTCPDLLQREQEVFFRNTPLPLGLSPDLPENGSYLATSETGVPILMTRDDDGEFHAFLNVCRHRGTQVVEDGRGRRGRFTCPFHAWTYRNSGELIAINKEERFGCIDKGEHGLVELPAAEKYGMLWVRPQPGEPVDVDACLGGLAPEMESWNLPIHPFGEEQTIEADINWKLAIDTFGENYHFDVLHRDTLAPEIYGNLQTSDAFGNNYRMSFMNKGGMKYVEENGLSLDSWPFRWITLNVYFLYPNTILLLDPAGVDLLRMYPHPKDPSKSVTQHRFYPEPAMAEILRQQAEQRGDNKDESRFVGFNRIVVDEDYLMAASTQKCAASGAQTHYTFGRNEPGLRHYHNAHRRGLGLPELELVTE